MLEFFEKMVWHKKGQESSVGGTLIKIDVPGWIIRQVCAKYCGGPLGQKNIFLHHCSQTSFMGL